MSEVRKAIVCPSCKSTGTIKGGVCTKCNHTIALYKNEFIEYVDYVNLQAARAMTSGLFKHTETDKHEERSERILECVDDYYRNAHSMQIFGALQDAKGFMQNLLHSKADKDAIKAAITLARSIGDIGRTLHEYFIAGGKANVQQTTKEGSSMATNKGAYGEDRGFTFPHENRGY